MTLPLLLVPKQRIHHADTPIDPESGHSARRAASQLSISSKELNANARLRYLNRQASQIPPPLSRCRNPSYPQATTLASIHGLDADAESLSNPEFYPLVFIHGPILRKPDQIIVVKMTIEIASRSQNPDQHILNPIRRQESAVWQADILCQGLTKTAVIERPVSSNDFSGMPPFEFATNDAAQMVSVHAPGGRNDASFSITVKIQLPPSPWQSLDDLLARCANNSDSDLAIEIDQILGPQQLPLGYIIINQTKWIASMDRELYLDVNF